MSSTQDARLDTAAAAAFIGVEPRTLEDWRRRNVGPEFIVISRRCVRYDRRALERFLAERTVNPGPGAGAD